MTLSPPPSALHLYDAHISRFFTSLFNQRSLSLLVYLSIRFTPIPRYPHLTSYLLDLSDTTSNHLYPLGFAFYPSRPVSLSMQANHPTVQYCANIADEGCCERCTITFSTFFHSARSLPPYPNSCTAPSPFFFLAILSLWGAFAHYHPFFLFSLARTARFFLQCRR